MSGVLYERKWALIDSQMGDRIVAGSFIDNADVTIGCS
jgi:hypothetical protein